MKITSLKARLLNIPRSATLTTSYGSWDQAPTILIELETDEGITGLGQASVDAPFYGETAVGMLANIRHHLAPVVVGADPMQITALNREMKTALPHHYFSYSGVEMALWDLKGKALGVPVYQLMGGKVRSGITLMGFVHHGAPEEMAAHATAQLDEHGYGVLKMKIGLDPAEDVKRYAAVAEAVRGRAVIQVDGNIGYNLTQAVPALKAMEDLGCLGAVEQPVERIEDMAELARRLYTPIMADEAIYGLPDAMEVVRRGAATLALMKISKHGGLQTVQQIGHLFEAAGFGLSIAIYYDLIAVAACHLASALPCVRWSSPATDLADTFVADAPAPVEGMLPTPDGPGLGVELDWDKVERFTVEA